MPDAFFQVFGDNQWMLGVMVVGLVGTVAGPWALIRAVSRPPKPEAED